MHSARIRRLIASRLVWFCTLGVLLAALQPFIATHFRHDGWEDEPGFRIRSVSAPTQFEPDERPDHRDELEVTLFVPSSARVDAPRRSASGLDGLMALVLALLPLTVLLWLPVLPTGHLRVERVPTTGGAPPPAAAPWRRQPPETAPPLSI